jgi:predicted nucleotidyltransferase
VGGIAHNKDAPDTELVHHAHAGPAEMLVSELRVEMKNTDLKLDSQVAAPNLMSRRPVTV